MADAAEGWAVPLRADAARQSRARGTGLRRIVLEVAAGAEADPGAAPPDRDANDDSGSRMTAVQYALESEYSCFMRAGSKANSYTTHSTNRLSLPHLWAEE